MELSLELLVVRAESAATMVESPEASPDSVSLSPEAQQGLAFVMVLEPELLVKHSTMLHSKPPFSIVLDNHESASDQQLLNVIP